MFRLGVDQHDGAGGIHDHHGVRRALQKPTELLLGLLKLPGPLPHQILQVLPIRLVLRDQGDPLQGAFHDDLYLVCLQHGFGHVVPGPQPDRFDGVGHGYGPGQDDDRRLRALRLERRDQGHAVHHGHAQVGEDDIGTLRCEDIQGLPPVLGLHHPESDVLEKRPQVQAQHLLVVDDQHLDRVTHPSLSPPPCAPRPAPAR